MAILAGDLWLFGDLLSYDTIGVRFERFDLVLTRMLLIWVSKRWLDSELVSTGRLKLNVCVIDYFCCMLGSLSPYFLKEVKFVWRV